MIYEHIADAIKAPKLIHLKENLFIARFESMKIYSALAAVKALLDKGKIKPTDTLIDSSSGIYAYALALACNKYCLKCHIIASKTVDAALKVQLELMGATVEPAKAAANLKMDQEYRVQRIHEILATRSDVHWMQQYHDDIHYLGYKELADLILENFAVPKLTLVGGVGSGCSTGAIATYLRNAGVEVTLHGIQPFGSVTFNSEHVDDPGIIIAGIGSAIPFKNVRYDVYNFIHWVSFSYCSMGSVSLLQDSGIFAGLSTGACHTVANWCAKQTDSPCLFIGADTGHRYVQNVFETRDKVNDINLLYPKNITELEQMAMPWSVMKWDRRDSHRMNSLSPIREAVNLTSST